MGGSRSHRLKHFHHAIIQFQEKVGQSQYAVRSGTCGLQDAVAIKSMCCENMGPSDLQEYCYEILVAEMLQLKGRKTDESQIVKHHGFSVDPPYLYIIMELCDMSLEALLHEPRTENTTAGGTIMNEIFIPSERCRYAHETAKGVQHCHDLKLIHRDLKTANVLLKAGLEGRLHAKLCDFGETIMQDVDRENVDDCLHGTPGWVAPEIYVPPRLYSNASDVFSLALIVFECIEQRTTLDSYKGAPDASVHIKPGYFNNFDDVGFVLGGGRPPLSPSSLREPLWARICELLQDNEASPWAQDPQHRCSATVVAAALAPRS